MEGLFGGEAGEMDRRDPSGLRAPGGLERPGEAGSVHFLPTLHVQQTDTGRENTERESRQNWLRPADLLREDSDPADERLREGPELERDRERREDPLPLDWQDLREQLSREMTREDSQSAPARGEEPQSREESTSVRAPGQPTVGGQGIRVEPTMRVDPVGRAPAAPGTAPPLPGADRQPVLAPAMRMGAVTAPVREDDVPRAEPRLSGTREAMADVSRRWDAEAPPPVERGFSASPPPVAASMRMEHPLPSASFVMSPPPEIRPVAPRPEPVSVQPLDIRRFGEENNRLSPRNEFRGGF